MVFDAHVHIGRTTWMHMDTDADQLVRMADRAGIDKMLVTDLTALMTDMFEGNELMRKFARQHPDRIIPYFTVSSARFGKRVIEDLERYVNDYGFRALKIYSVPPLYKMCDPYMYPVLEKAAQYKLPVLAHSTAEECEQVSRVVPEVIVINAHTNGSPQGQGDWHRSIAAAKAYANIYLDTTTSSFDNNMIETAVAEVGADRILYGSDMPLLCPILQVAKVRQAEITEAEKDLILGGNIQRLLDAQGQ